MALCSRNAATRLAQSMDSYIELGKQLLGTIAAKLSGVRSTTLTLCAHDPFKASKALSKPSKPTEQGAMPDLNMKTGQGSWWWRGV